MFKTTKEIAQDLRKGLKEEYNLNRNKVRVAKRSESAIDVKLLTEVENIEEIENFVQQFEDIDRDEVTGEILQAGNTFIFFKA